MLMLRKGMIPPHLLALFSNLYSLAFCSPHRKHPGLATPSPDLQILAVTEPKQCLKLSFGQVWMREVYNFSQHL